MMQAAEPRPSDHATASHCWGSRIRSSFVQPEMCSIFMIVGKIILQSPAQRSLVPHDEVVQARSPDGAHQSFDVRILVMAAKSFP
jgi:hypothetical protein